MPRTPLHAADDLAAADVIHKQFTALPASATIGDVRAWFARSTHRRMAFLADDGRYAGSIALGDLTDDIDGAQPATTIARSGPTVAPDAPARTGYDLAVLTDANRVPVVTADGHLLGVVGVTDDRAAFCGAASS